VKARMVATLVMLVTLALLTVPSAQASVEPIVAVNSFFTALNTGDHTAALAAFTLDATATLARGETYTGLDEISDMVDMMEHPGTSYEIVYAHSTGDTVTVVADVSYHGIRWGEDTIILEVREGKVHTFHEKAFHLQLGA
jgi:hypothetical protein